MKQIFTNLKVLLTLLLLCGVSSVWADDVTIEINTSNSGVTGSYATKTFKVDGVTFGFTLWMKSTTIQAKASTTNSLYNVDAIPGNIKSITFVTASGKTARAIKVYGGTGQKPTNEITAPTTAMTMTFDFSGKEYTYFSMTTPSNACYFDKITITYEERTTPAKSLTSIAVSGTPNNITYYAGEEFDPAGLVVTGTYDDASTDEITNGIVWSVDPETLSLGTTSVSVTAKVEEVESEPYKVNVTVSEKPALPSYTLVTDASELMDGDIIVLGVMKDDEWYANAGINGKFLDSADATCKDGILESEEAVGITLIAADGGWNLKIGDKYINTTAAKALTFADDASTVWTIEIDGAGNATVAAGDYGCFLYNVGSPRFLNYTSATSATMLLPQIFKKKVTQTVTISEVGYATYSSDKALVVPTDETVFGAKVNDAGTAVTLIPVEAGTVLEAGTGFIVAGNGSVTFEVSAAAGEEIEENELKGTGATSKTLVADEAYLLGAKDGKAIFSICSAGTLGANKAYLPAPSTVGANSTLGFDDATGIISLSNDGVKNGAIYNLNGQKVGRDYKGIVIMNGKKMFNK